MQVTLWSRVQEIVSAAAEMDPATRQAWVEHTCGGDAALRQQVDDMLAAFSEAGDFFEQAIHHAATRAASLHEFAPGDRLGPYEITQVLGHGGMGTVYRARRADEQFQQDVAIKAVRSALGASEQLFLRFRAERQILANINHPNIARLLDGGVSESGMPFLVMEFIEGQTLDRFVENNKPSLPQRLTLFRQLCAAVQHAHQNLVVHRDLKPGNVMVTADGTPKLLDFGIAKLLIEEPADGTVFLTRPVERVLTPEYASPEQMRGETITTATDVYGLGVLLYELIAGRRPFDLKGLSPLEIERLVCDTQPKRPGAPTKSRWTKWAHHGGNDLDRIVLKAMHKQPTRRYSSAADLSDDVQRYLAGFPVKARPDSLRYRSSRFVQRHVWAVSAATILFVAIVGLGITSAVQARRARHEAASADAVSQYLTGLFEDVQPDSTQGRDLTALQLLNQGTERLDHAWQGEPLVKARLLSTLGSVYYQLGDLVQAQRLLAQAMQLYRINEGPDSKEVAELGNSLGEAELDAGDYTGSLRDYSDSVRIYERVKPESSELADAMDGLSGILWKIGRFKESEQYHLRSIAMASHVLGPEAKMTLVDKNNYAVLLLDMGRYREAEAIHRDVLAVRRKALGEYNSHTAASMCNLAVVLQHVGRFGEARQLLEQSLAVRRVIYRGEHPNIAASLRYLGALYQDAGNYAMALKVGREALEVTRRLQTDRSLDTAEAEDQLGMAQLATGDLPGARTSIEKALAVRQQQDPTSVPLMSQSYDHLAMVDLAQGYLPSARANAERALAMRGTFYGTDSDKAATSQAHLGRVLLAHGEWAEAETAFQKALHVAEATFGARPNPLTADSMDGLGKTLSAEHKPSGPDLQRQAAAMRRAIDLDADAPLKWAAPLAALRNKPALTRDLSP